VVAPSDADVRTYLRKQIGALRERADTLELALNAIEGTNGAAPPAAKPSAKPGRVSKARRPTTGKGGPQAGEVSESRAKVLAYLERHPGAGPNEIGRETGLKPVTVSYHLKQIRKKA
jgi:DNA-binding transcriptional ArsR family regulator